MGGGSKGSGGQESADALAAIAEDLFSETAGLRGDTIGRLEGTLAGEFPSGPTFEAQKLAAEQQFDAARERTIAGSPSGGALTGALGDVESARAATLAGVTSDIFNRDIQAAQAAAFGAPQISIQGLGSAANAQAGIAQAEAAGKGGVAQGAGLLGAAALKP